MIKINDTPLIQNAPRFCCKHRDSSYTRAQFLIRYFDPTEGKHGLFLAAPVCHRCKDYVAEIYDERFGNIEIVPVIID